MFYNVKFLMFMGKKLLIFKYSPFSSLVFLLTNNYSKPSIFLDFRENYINEKKHILYYQIYTKYFKDILLITIEISIFFY